jgi:hypothetical protein
MDGPLEPDFGLSRSVPGQWRELLLLEIEQHRVTGDRYETHSRADHRAHQALRPRRSQSCDFIEYLLSPALANLVSALADGIGFGGVIIDPVEDPDISQFIVELCQNLVARHIVNPGACRAHAQTNDTLLQIKVVDPS